jgi:hypothetical protein
LQAAAPCWVGPSRWWLRLVALLMLFCSLSAACRVLCSSDKVPGHGKGFSPWQCYCSLCCSSRIIVGSRCFDCYQCGMNLLLPAFQQCCTVATLQCWVVGLSLDMTWFAPLTVACLESAHIGFCARGASKSGAELLRVCN